MTHERKTAMARRAAVLLSAALWLWIAVAVAQGSPAAAPANVDQPNGMPFSIAEAGMSSARSMWLVTRSRSAPRTGAIV